MRLLASLIAPLALVSTTTLLAGCDALLHGRSASSSADESAGAMGFPHVDVTGFPTDRAHPQVPYAVSLVPSLRSGCELNWSGHRAAHADASERRSAASS